jgi:hypothetical protein
MTAMNLYNTTLDSPCASSIGVSLKSSVSLIETTNSFPFSLIPTFPQLIVTALVTNEPSLSSIKRPVPK